MAPTPDAAPAAPEDARVFTAAQRKRAASAGTALPDGSFPIVTVADLRNAIAAYGLAANKAAAKAHIIRRARALGATKLLPASFKPGDRASTQETVMHACPDCDRTGFTPAGLAEHAAAVHTHAEVQQLLTAAIRRKTVDDMGRSRYPYIRDVADDWVVYDLDERLYRASYSVTGDGVVDIKDGVEVVAKTSYVPVKRSSS